MEKYVGLVPLMNEVRRGLEEIRAIVDVHASEEVSTDGDLRLVEVLSEPLMQLSELAEGAANAVSGRKFLHLYTPELMAQAAEDRKEAVWTMERQREEHWRLTKHLHGAERPLPLRRPARWGPISHE